MADANDLTKPDLQSNWRNGDVPDTLKGHFIRLWRGDYTGMANLVSGMLRWAISGTTTLAGRLYQRQADGSEVEITSLPSVSIGGNAATATTAAACSGNAATATTAAACSGNAATATTAAACSGNAATATKLATARTIAGSTFDGSANVDISYSSLLDKPAFLLATDGSVGALALFNNGNTPVAPGTTYTGAAIGQATGTWKALLCISSYTYYTVIVQRIA